MTEVTQTLTRREFVRRFMRECGMTYSQACRAYETMCGVFAHGVVTGSKIRIGRVGSVQPVWQKPRSVTMHFKVTKGRGIVKSKRDYVFGGRYKFKFVLYRQFVETHALRWFDSEPVIGT